MKINVTYEGKDIERLVRRDLDAKGLSGEAVIRFDDGQVLVEIEGEFDEPAPPRAPDPRRGDILAGEAEAESDAGMAEVLAQSSTFARRTGLYPASERRYMEGESDEPPTG